MALDYMRRTPAQRFTEERFGTVWLESDDQLYRGAAGRRLTNIPTRNVRKALTGRITGQVQLDGKWHTFTQPADAESVWISPYGKRA